MHNVVVRESKELVVKFRDMDKKGHFKHETLAVTHG